MLPRRAVSSRWASRLAGFPDAFKRAQAELGRLPDAHMLERSDGHLIGLFRVTTSRSLNTDALMRFGIEVLLPGTRASTCACATARSSASPGSSAQARRSSARSSSARCAGRPAAVEASTTQPQTRDVAVRAPAGRARLRAPGPAGGERDRFVPGHHEPDAVGAAAREVRAPGLPEPARSSARPPSAGSTGSRSAPRARPPSCRRSRAATSRRS